MNAGQKPINLSNGEVQIDADSVVNLLVRYKFKLHDEKSLQDGIEQVLSMHAIPYKRELAISRKDRPDFMLTGGLAIEVKIKGGLSPLLRQASRYLLDEKITHLLVVGTPSWIGQIPDTLHGKPITRLRLLGSML